MTVGTAVAVEGQPAQHEPAQYQPAQYQPAQHMPTLYVPTHPVRFVTAASLFDGHDAAINLIRRLLQAQGAEVVHLGHNRSVEGVVTAAIAEDVQGVAVSSYQGGHVEYFKYLVDQLRAAGRDDIKVYGGGGGVIVGREIAELEAYGVRRIFSPADGQRLGLARMVNVLIEECDVDLAAAPTISLDRLLAGEPIALARTITDIESGSLLEPQCRQIRAHAPPGVPVLGITGTGGSGKSCLTDELVRRFRLDLGDSLRIAVIAIDPTRRRGGGALLGDRIRMNAIGSPQIYFRSLATRGAASEVPPPVALVVDACRAAGFDLVIVETPGIGQGSSAVTDIANVSLYVMTPEYGAPSQLEKIDMLELADVVAINKFDRRGAKDALRDVRRQWARGHEAFSVAPADLPVFGTIASRLNDNGVTALYQHVRDTLAPLGLPVHEGALSPSTGNVSEGTSVMVPNARIRYLAEIADTVRDYHARTAEQVAATRRADAIAETITFAGERGVDLSDLETLRREAADAVDTETRHLVESWPETVRAYSGEEIEVRSNGAVKSQSLTRISPSGTPVPRVALPRVTDRAELLRWLRSENLPGKFPFTGGVFPFKREEEQPTRMFAGEGDPFRTNRRFHLLADDQPTTRLSTAFDPVTLYGCDPDERPDIYGKIGTSGVSVATLDDMKALFDGFDLCDPSTSVSMTINGPPRRSWPCS